MVESGTMAAHVRVRGAVGAVKLLYFLGERKTLLSCDLIMQEKGLAINVYLKKKILLNSTVVSAVP